MSLYLFKHSGVEGAGYKTGEGDTLSAHIESVEMFRLRQFTFIEAAIINKPHPQRKHNINTIACATH